jgi:hypothetical protein
MVALGTLKEINADVSWLHWGLKNNLQRSAMSVSVSPAATLPKTILIIRHETQGQLPLESTL